MTRIGIISTQNPLFLFSPSIIIMSNAGSIKYDPNVLHIENEILCDYHQTWYHYFLIIITLCTFIGVKIICSKLELFVAMYKFSNLLNPAEWSKFKGFSAALKTDWISNVNFNETNSKVSLKEVKLILFFFSFFINQ